MNRWIRSDRWGYLWLVVNGHMTDPMIQNDLSRVPKAQFK